MKLKKILCAVVAASCVLLAMTACSNDGSNGASNAGSQGAATAQDSSGSEAETSGIDQLAAPVKGDTIATISVQNYGDIKIRLFQESTPKAYENFVTHAKEKYYNGTIFHRVISDFMIQTGDPSGTGEGGKSIWGDSFSPETDNSLRHYRGALAMAQTAQAKIGSQFYIVQNNKVEDSMMEQYSSTMSDAVKENYSKLGGTPWLDGEYTVFGQVFEGMDIVDKIAQAEVDDQSKPTKDIKVKTITISKMK